MEWEEVQELIRTTLIVGFHLSETRIIKEIPPYQCNRYQYNDTGYSVQIGDNDSLDIPWSMLKTVFNDSIIQPGRIYNNGVFIIHYAHQAKVKGCHIHVIGEMFELSGVAEARGYRNYVIL